jgi:hypothetical protein
MIALSLLGLLAAGDTAAIGSSIAQVHADSAAGLAAESARQGWCEAALNTNGAERDVLAKEGAWLANSECLARSASELALETAAVKQEIGALNAAMAQATTLRNAEAATNAKAVADALAARNQLDQFQRTFDTCSQFRTGCTKVPIITAPSHPRPRNPSSHHPPPRARAPHQHIKGRARR